MYFIFANFAFIMRVILFLMRPLADGILEVVHWLFYNETEPLPPIDNKILLMSAKELAQKIRRKEISAVEVMEVYVSRIKAVQRILNPCVDNRFEEALADARAADRMLKDGTITEEELAETKPLFGVPFTCKEIVGVKGLAQTWGRLRFKNRKAPEDSDAAAEYKKAGAIPVVVTNVPIMSAWWDTSNNVFGTTRNPYSSKRAVGGSSGGEAALISSAGAVIGIGSDLAGSIRIPSSFCGIYGHKATRGIISIKATWPVFSNSSHVIKKLSPFMYVGPMCRYVEDLQLLVKVLSGNNSGKLRLDERVDFSEVKVYYMEELPGYLLSATPDVKAAVLKAVKYFEEKHGSTTRKLKIEELKYSLSIWFSKMFEAGASFRDMEPEKNGFFSELSELLKCIIGKSEYDLRALYHACIEFKKRTKFCEDCLQMYDVIEKKLDDILAGNAILILPTHPEPPPFPLYTIPNFDNVGYTCIFNVLGLPVTSVPSGQSNDLPIGLQIVAKKNHDHLTLAAAAELNDLFGGWRSPCPVLA